jgi:4-amino-4-deoxy-L-arabinose transferase-like glycosyltransferase
VNEGARRNEWAVLALITVLAAALRLTNIGKVSPDPFYDAAVRSMGLSWHNFFFGAFEPSGSVSIDKPPVDLWLQVVSVKVLGFSSTTLKLPEVFAGIASVPLCFAVVRRVWSSTAALAAALALAVLPIEVITARSDTMDAVMMALILLALLLIVHACEKGSVGLLIAGAAALGVAFDVKLLESLVALPGLALLAYFGIRGASRRRAALTLLAGAVYVAVALSWLTATLLFPAHDRPYAIGSTNGSAWNAAFVFNGTDRISGKTVEASYPAYEQGHHYPVATQSERDRIPIVPSSPTRLFARVGPLSGERLGAELLAALILGIPAFLFAALRLPPLSRARTRARARSASSEDAPPVDDDAETPPVARDAETPRLAGQTDDDAFRVRRALVIALSVWMVCGIVLFSHMARLQPRYVESFTPAVAAMLGVGVAWAGAARTRAQVATLVLALAANTFFVERLIYGVYGIWWLTFIASLAAIGLLVLTIRARGPARARAHAAPSSERTASLLAHATIAASMVAILALPFATDVSSIKEGVTDAGYVGALPSGEQDALSAYLRAHEGGAKFELAAESATGIGSLIVQDARPVLVFTTYNGSVFTTVAKLQQLITAGEVKYAFLNTTCPRAREGLNAACAEPAEWVRAHGTDVSELAGLRKGVLWLLPGARA